MNGVPVARQSRTAAFPQKSESTPLKLYPFTIKRGFFCGFGRIRRGAVVNGVPVARQSRTAAFPQEEKTSFVPKYKRGFYI